MKKTMPAFEARRQFGKLLDDVAQKGDRIVVERNGREVAAVVPVWLYQTWERDMQYLSDLMDLAARNANLSAEEAEALVAEEIRAAREEARRGV